MAHRGYGYGGAQKSNLKTDSNQIRNAKMGGVGDCEYRGTTYLFMTIETYQRLYQAANNTYRQPPPQLPQY